MPRRIRHSFPVGVIAATLVAILTVQAHVYDHRFAAAMKTEILRRSRRELLACGVLKEVDAAAKP